MKNQLNHVERNVINEINERAKIQDDPIKNIQQLQDFYQDACAEYEYNENTQLRETDMAAIENIYYRY